MNLAAQLTTLEQALARAAPGSDTGELWPSDVLHWAAPFTQSELSRIETALGIVVPNDYRSFITLHGPFGFAPADAPFNAGKRRLMTADEIIDRTTFWRRELDFRAYGFESAIAENLNRVLRGGWFFQFAHTDSHSNFYLMSPSDVRLWDEDDLTSMLELRAPTFEAHMLRLLDELAAKT